MSYDLSPPTLPFRQVDQGVSAENPAELKEDARLQLVNDRWSSLPEAVKQAIFDTVFEQA